MGVGKTTLAKGIAKEKGYQILPEAARVVAKMGHKLDKKITVETEYKILEMQKILESQDAPWIADRCLIDLMAYVVVLFRKEAGLINAVRKALEKAKYDLVIYIAPEFPIKKDGIRTTDTKFQKEIDTRIKIVLKDAGVKWIKVSGSKINRLNQVLAII